jgi:nuclear pore complex protein Nup98-Nup96
LNAVFSLLTGNRLLDACTTSVENRDFRLALLLSQSSGGNDTTRDMIRKQLNDWNSSNVSIFKLYFTISQRKHNY